MFFRNKKPFLLLLLICFHTMVRLFLPVHAASYEELLADAEARKLLPIQTNDIENWPAGPAIGAASAILMEANTGVILYAKNIDEKHYPASTTKLLTCLLAVEHASLNDMIPFSHDAVFTIESGSSNMGMDVGQEITLEQALYGILVRSANEVANAVAEYVGGDMETFAAMMNEKARELGCQNSNFVNAHGLFDENHYTSAADLAIIASAFFRNELLSKIANTVSYEFTPTATQPDEFVIRNKHKLVTGEIAGENIVGGKTGYTDIARQTLVTCAEKNNMKLVCVILKEESPEQFNDTVKLFDYGFSNFQVATVAENETRYIIENASFFQTGNDVFGDSSPLLSLNQNSYLIMPNTTGFSDLSSEISYQTAGEPAVAEVTYYYHGAFVGSATVDLASENRSTYEFDPELPPTETETGTAEEENTIFINVKNVLIFVLVIATVIVLFFIVRAFILNYHFDRRKSRRRKLYPRKKYRRGRFNDFYP